MQNILKYIKIY